MNIWYGEGGCEDVCGDGGGGEGSSECCAENFRIRKILNVIWHYNWYGRYNLFIAKAR